MERQLQADVDELLRKAEQQDTQDEVDGQSLPQGITRRERRRETMQTARWRLKERAAVEAPVHKSSEGRGEHEEPKGGAPRAEEQINLTDPDSSLMRKSKWVGFQQAYNAWPVVDAEGTQLVLATDVLRTPSDANQLEAGVTGVPECVGEGEGVLADGGFVNADAIERVQREGGSRPRWRSVTKSRTCGATPTGPPASVKPSS